MTTKANYKLTCLHGGDQNTFTVVIPHTANVDKLRKLICQKQDIFHNIDPTNLICSKVEMDLEPLQGHLSELRLNDFHQPICLTNPTELILELWEEQPLCQHIHIFVQIFTRKQPSQSLCTTRYPVLSQAAWKLYNTLWLKDLGEILLDVPDCKGLKYLPDTKVDDLQLHTLGYNEEVLLVRKEYLIALDALNMKSSTGGGIIITGPSGIGKTFFLYYALLHRLSSGKPTAFQQGHLFLLFDQSGVEVYDATTTKWEFGFKEKIWALSDAIGIGKQPCHAFSNFSKMGKAWIVQADQTSESPLSSTMNQWNQPQWHLECMAGSYVMGSFTSDELKALSIVLHFNTKTFLKYFERWGPDARICTQLARGLWNEDMLQMITGLKK